jgi:hypothetical protein
MPRLPDRCPSCAGSLKVTRLACSACGTKVEGEFSLCPVCSLSPENRALLDLFLSARGNAKEVQRILKLSYPTTRAKLEQLWAALALPPPAPTGDAGRPALQIIAEMEEGKIGVDEAERLLRTRGIRPSGA